MRKFLATILIVNLIITINIIGPKGNTILTCASIVLALTIIFNALIVNRILSTFIIYSSILFNILTGIFILMNIYVTVITTPNFHQIGEDIIFPLIATLLFIPELIVIGKILFIDIKKEYNNLQN